jgi:CheY-like chemotaxis protein
MGKDGGWWRQSLVAEDTIVSLKMLKRMLEKAEYEAMLAGDGQQAVSKFESDRSIDLILMDVHMPVMDGLEATALIRNIEAKSGDKNGIPIIALSAAAMQTDRERGVAAGMSHYLTKPVNRKELLATLESNIWGSENTRMATLARENQLLDGNRHSMSILPYSCPSML